MKGLICIFLVLSVSLCFSQKEEFNFIISIDGSLENIYAENFVLQTKEASTEVIDFNYIPGKLSIKKENFEKLISDDVINISLIVSSFSSLEENIKPTKYKIEDFRLAWLTQGTYFILYLYNTDKKVYREIYDPLPGKNFTFEFDWSEGSMRRVKKG